MTPEKTDGRLVRVEKPRGMQEPLLKIGTRLLQEFQGRFSIAQPRQFTNNERQIIVQALTTMLQALEGGPFDE